MGDKGGGGDASSMIKYGDKALALQEKIYNEQKADAQPWYQTGTGAVNQLSNLLGIKSQPTASSRQSLIDQYKPQFTSQNTTTASGPTSYSDSQGRVHNFANPSDFDLYKIYKPDDYTPINQGPQTTSSTDESGLNSYVDNLLSQQNQTPTDGSFGSLAKSFSMDDYQQDPGYQFRLGEGQKALERKLNASGKTYSPEAAKALIGYNQDMGSQEYNNAFNRYNINQDNLFNRLATLSGFGQTASGQIANAGGNYANSASDIYTGQGNAITAANLAAQNNKSSMFNTLLGAGANLGSAAIFASDRRLKENIEYLGEEKGYPIYAFNYINIPEKTYIGCMAQDVLQKMPEAIGESEGFMTVNYDMIGIKMREVTEYAA